MSPHGKTAAAKAICLGLAVFGLLCHAKAVLEAGWLSRFDDAYMFTRYARHFLDGGGFSWNLADGPAYGITSPAHLFLVTAGLAATGWTDSALLTALSAAAGLLAMAALVGLGFLVQRGRAGAPSWAPLLAVPYLVFLTPFEYHSLTGMETMLALLANSLLAAAVLILGRRPAAGSLALCLAAGYFAISARPDQGLYALLLPPLYLLATARDSGKDVAWKYARRYLMLFAVVLAGDALLSKMLFGDFLPLAFFAKKSGFYDGYTGGPAWSAMAYFLAFWKMTAPLLALAALKTRRDRLRPSIAIVIPLASTLAYYATVVQIMGFEARYYFPSLAFVFLLAFLALWPEENAGPAPAAFFPGPRRLLLAVLLVISLTPPVTALAVEQWRKRVIGEVPPLRPELPSARPTGGRLPMIWGFEVHQLMSKVVEQLPAGAVIAASEYGWVGSRSPGVTIVDLVGLHDRELARHGFSADAVLGRQPDLIWLPHPHYSGTIALLLDHPRFRRDYDYYPHAFTYGVALRRTSPRLAGLEAALREGFAAAYPGLELADYRSAPVAASAARPAVN